MTSKINRSKSTFTITRGGERQYSVGAQVKDVDDLGAHLVISSIDSDDVELDDCIEDLLEIMFLYRGMNCQIFGRRININLAQAIYLKNFLGEIIDEKAMKGQQYTSQ